MIFKIIIFILISLKPSLSSRVIDNLSQDPIFISDYCPEMKYCQEGSHVMCMYYDESSRRGPLCENYVRTTITPDMIDLFLEIINSVRSRVATGVEKGKDGVPLPRAYGMMRLEWDKELATFAQVLADQCLLSKGDDCRATNRFPNPSQSMSMINFFHPDWAYFTNNASESEPGLTEEKVLYGIKRALGAWDPEKKTVTKEMVLNYPSPENLASVERLYLNTIRGAATHMGCGMSAFSKLNYAENHRNSIVNMLEIICNFSDSPQVSQPVYMTDPPIPGTGFSEECGCPEGYKESEGCLCEEDLDYVKPTTSTAAAYVQPFYKNKKLRGPTVIDEEFTEQPLSAPSRDYSHSHKSAFKPHELPNDLQNNRYKKRKQDTKYAFLPIFKIESNPDEPINARARADDRLSLRFDNSTLVNQNQNRVQKYAPTSDENFEQIKPKPIKKLTKNRSYYIKNKDLNNHVSLIHRAYPGQAEESSENSIEETIDKYTVKENTDSDFSTAEENVDRHLSSQRRSYNDEDITNINIMKQTNDHNLMNLLDILEHKVKNIDMNFKEKEIFDAKMRKIYKAVWSKQMQQRNQMQQANKMQQTKLMQHIKQKQSVDLHSDDIENEFRELKNLLKLKSQHFNHESFHNMRRVGGTENMAKNEKKLIKNGRRKNNNIPEQHKQNFERLNNDMIDDKLLEILRHKNDQIISDGEIKTKNDINGRQTYMDRNLKDINEPKSNDAVTPNNGVEQIDYDDERDYTSVPVPRNQETFNKYDRRNDNDFQDTDDRKVLKLQNVHTNTDVEYPPRVSHIPKIGKEHIIGDRRMSNTHKMNNSIRPSGPRVSSYIVDPEEHQDGLSLRRLEDYNQDRPLRRFQNNQINTQWKSKIHQLTNPYYMSDRATY